MECKDLNIWIIEIKKINETYKTGDCNNDRIELLRKKGNYKSQVLTVTCSTHEKNKNL